MKKYLLIAIMLLSISVHAQNAKMDGKPYEYMCIIKGVENLSGVLRLTLEWPDQEESHNIRDEKGRKIEFKNMTDAFNYMTKRGWTYVDAIAVNRVYNFIFKKLVTSDQEAKESIYFKEDFKK